MDCSIEKKRIMLFLLGCIPTRMTFAYLGKTLEKPYINYLAYIALIISLGFAIIYMFNLRQTGPEVFGDKIWWNDFRPIHALLYFLFFYYTVKHEYKHAWAFIAIDTFIGLTSFIHKHSPSII